MTTIESPVDSTALVSAIAANAKALGAAMHGGVRAAPVWWRIELVLHQGTRVVRNVTERPDARHIMENGWYERADNGDEFMVGYASIATVKISGMTGPMTGATS